MYVQQLEKSLILHYIVTALTPVFLSLFSPAGMASMQPQQLPQAGYPVGYIQHPQALPNMLPGGFLPQQSVQVEQMGLQSREVPFVNRTQRTSRSIKSISDDEGSSDFERNQEATGRRQSLGERSGGSSENDGGDGIGDKPTVMERTERRKKQKKASQDEKEEASTVVPLKSKKNRMQKKGSSSSSGSNQSETVKTVKFIQPEVYQSLPIPGQGGVMISPPTPIPSGRVISSPFPAQQFEPVSGPSEMGGAEKNNNNPSDEVNEKDMMATEKKKKSAETKGGKKKRREKSRSPSLERTQPKEHVNQKENSGDVLYELDHDNSAVYGEVTMSRVESPPSLSEVEERSKFVQFPSPAKGARRSPIPDDESGNAFGNRAQDM